MRFKSSLIFILFVSFVVNVHSKDNGVTPTKDEKVRALNNYVSFVNESIHGLLIVNKLLENYNLDLNKYVDLESYKINNYTNEDLPFDVFKDPDKLFFNELTPYEWFERCKAESSFLVRKDADKLNKISVQLFNTIKKINNLRFDLDQLTNNIDLSKRENIGKVYLKLENAAEAFELFFSLQQQMEVLIYSYVQKEKFISNKWTNLDLIYNASRTLLIKVRHKDEIGIDDLVSKVNINNTKIQNIEIKTASSRKEQLTWGNIQKSIAEIITAGENYLENANVADHYKIYGKHYFYYNIGLISRFNRFGTGLASEINALMRIEGIDKIKKFELPHVFKVIYPNKIEPVRKVESPSAVISALPEALSERKTTTSKNVIRAESKQIELRFYDHLLQDGDIVSINFNGDWILKDAEIEKQPQTIKLNLNPVGRNYLILHANNLGVRPPNTLAVSYIYHSKKYEIVLRSDLDSSEMIEIILD